jgi:hypothetical protein
MNTDVNANLTTHTEELLVKYMDGGLSTAEQENFETLLTTNPTFAEEVRVLVQFDEFLETAPLATRWSNSVDTTFLSGIQQQLAHVVASGAATTLAGSALASSIVGKSGTGAATATIATKGIVATSLLTKTLIVAALCGTVGIGVWKYRASTEPQAAPILPSEQTVMQSSNQAKNNQAPNNQAPNNQAPNNQAPNNQAPSNHATFTDAVPSKLNLSANHTPQKDDALKHITTQADDKSETPAPPASPVNTTIPEQDARSSASIERADKQREIAERLTQELRHYEQSGDNANAAITAKRLGMVARQVGHFEEGNIYFAKALKTAQSLKLKELEGEIRAEQAVLYRATGNMEQALSTLREAIKNLSASESSSLAKWTKELERWEKK